MFLKMLSFERKVYIKELKVLTVPVFLPVDGFGHLGLKDGFYYSISVISHF